MDHALLGVWASANPTKFIKHSKNCSGLELEQRKSAEIFSGTEALSYGAPELELLGQSGNAFLTAEEPIDIIQYIPRRDEM